MDLLSIVVGAGVGVGITLYTQHLRRNICRLEQEVRRAELLQDCTRHHLRRELLRAKQQEAQLRRLRPLAAITPPPALEPELVRSADSGMLEKHTKVSQVHWALRMLEYGGVHSASRPANDVQEQLVVCPQWSDLDQALANLFETTESPSEPEVVALCKPVTSRFLTSDQTKEIVTGDPFFKDFLHYALPEVLEASTIFWYPHVPGIIFIQNSSAGIMFCSPQMQRTATVKGRFVDKGVYMYPLVGEREGEMATTSQGRAALVEQYFCQEVTQESSLARAALAEILGIQLVVYRD